jgi:RNA polymerase sigma factor (sigma-70 family)
MLDNLPPSLLGQDGADRADGELLECFISQRNEAAFAALLRRHGPMVLGVCRRILRDEADAEDAFQATFLVLVRRAASIEPRGMVGNWLYGVAHRTALKAKARNCRRRAKEREAARPQPQALADDGGELRALLDQVLHALPDKYRAPIVLCDLEGKSIKEAARQLGCPQGTVGTRLARGRSLLARRLTRQGLTLSVAAVAAFLQDAAPAGVTASLMESTVKAAATAGPIPAEVAALREGVVRAMFRTRLRTATALVLGLGLFAVATSNVADHLLAGTPAATAEEPKTDQEKLQGSWVLVAGDMNGDPAPEGYIGNFRAVFKGNKLVFRTKDDKPIPRFSREWTFQLDPKAKPKAIDLQSGDHRAAGIYALEGETLKLCGAEAGGKRPTEFKGGPGLLFLTLKREPAPKGENK